MNQTRQKMQAMREGKETDSKIPSAMDSALYKMAKSGDVDALRQLAPENMAFLVATTPGKNTTLHVAARHGRLNFVVDVIDLCPSLLLAQNSRGDTAMHVAARDGSFVLVGVLIDCARKKGCEKEMLEMRNAALNTALHEAAWNHHHRIVKSLVLADGDLIFLVNGSGASPLYLAAEEGALQSVDYIVEAANGTVEGACGGPDDRTPLHVAVIRGHLDIVKKLIQKVPSLIGKIDKNLNTSLHYAASLGNLEMVRVLLELDISIAYATNGDGQSAVHVASSNGHVEVIKEVLQLCPYFGDVVDAKGQNALHVAVESGKLEVIKFILKIGDLKELINEPDYEGNTALHLATIRRDIFVLNLLLADKRVDIRAINNKSMTALDIAESDKELTMKFRKIVICTTLIQVGAPRSERQLPIQGNRAHINNILAPRIESYKALSKVILVLAGLIITLAFAAAFTIPGGYKNQSPHEGIAMFRTKPCFWAFLIADSIAIFSAIITALLLIWAGIGDQDLSVSIISIAARLMATALGSLSVAFLFGLWLIVSKWLCITILLIFIVVLCLSLHSFCFQFSLFLLLVKQIFSTRSVGRSVAPYSVKSQYNIINPSRLLVISR